MSISQVGNSSSSEIQPTQPENNKTEKVASISGVTGSTSIKTMKELQEKAPELYDGMVKALAMDINRQSKESQERIKKMLRENQS